MHSFCWDAVSIVRSKMVGLRRYYSCRLLLCGYLSIAYRKRFFALQKKNKELNETKKKLEKACKRTEDLKTLIYYRYLLAKNDVDLCKKKIDCNAYLYERRHCEEMIEFYLKKIWNKDV